jgi:cyclophilin family peptidyl-prolyl cis-trans isomerase/HEAT repeat protein
VLLTRASPLVVLLLLSPVALAAVGCGRSGSHAAGADGGEREAGAVASPPAVAIARAADLRRAKDVPMEARTSHDPGTRRQSARALARIADAASLEGLVAHLADEDPETVAWAAYGLGYACKGHEDEHVRILSARAASLPGAAESRRVGASRGVAQIDPHVAIARATGRCGGLLAEQSLVALLKMNGAWTEPALLGLGDLAKQKKQLGAEAMTALLEVASRAEDPHRDVAFYALSRAEAGEAFGRRVVDVARGALGRASDARILAIKTLGRAAKEHKETAREVATELGHVTASGKGFSAGERAEAARALGTLGDPGQSAIAEAIGSLTPDRDPIAIADLTGPSFHVLYTLLGALLPESSKRAASALQALAVLAPPAEPKPGLARRLAELRCAAALALAKGAHDADVLRKCDAEGSEISQRARLTSLLRRKLEGERRTVFRAFAASEHLRIREEAVEALGAHGELGDAAAAILADALTSKRAGLVATAADVLHAHPERAMILAESERRAALDPKAPPPTSAPTQEVAPVVARALVAAINEKWPEDRFETRIALLEAAASVRLPQAKRVCELASNDPNTVVRERAQKALRALGEPVAPAPPEADREAKPAAEIGKTLGQPTKVVFSTDVGELAVVLEPELSPITATRIASLVESGFYKGVVVHRVVPGFVVQFGDPEGDGYGGSGTSLRCETSPVPFAALDVGMALAGRDTGSSQIFVTLARTPHLDGEYTRVGRAEGDWASVAAGDVIADARVVP